MSKACTHLRNQTYSSTNKCSLNTKPGNPPVNMPWNCMRSGERACSVLRVCRFDSPINGQAYMLAPHHVATLRTTELRANHGPPQPASCASISDSFAIAEYLDKNYPSSPLIFPIGTQGLRVAFGEAYITKIQPLASVMIPDICHNMLTPASITVYKPRMEKIFGTKFDNFSLQSEGAVEGWQKLRDGLGDVAHWYVKSDGPFMMGNTVSWADFDVVAPLLLVRIVWGRDSLQWGDITTWNNRIWGRLVNTLDKYMTVI